MSTDLLSFEHPSVLLFCSSYLFRFLLYLVSLFFQNRERLEEEMNDVCNRRKRNKEFYEKKEHFDDKQLEIFRT